MGRSGEVQTMTLCGRSRPAFVFRIRAALLLIIIACSVAARASPADANRMAGMESTGSLFVLINRIHERGIQAHSVQVAARGGPIQPAPIQAALDLLKWSPDRVPAIEVADMRPSRVSPLAEGWIVYDWDGRPRPTIYVAAWSALYRAVLANRLDVHFDVIRLASVLAHERAHIEHGPDEELAYLAQLTTLERLRARDIDLANVRRALEASKRHSGRR